MSDDRSLEELRDLVLSACNLEEEDEAAELTFDEPIFGPGSRLELDSLDAVEIVFLIQKRYGVRIETHAESREAMASLRTLLAYIQAQPVDQANQ